MEKTKSDVATALDLLRMSLATAKGAKAVLDVAYEGGDLDPHEVDAGYMLDGEVAAIENVIELLTETRGASPWLQPWGRAAPTGCENDR